MLRRLLLAAAGLVAAWVVASLLLFVWPPAESAPPAHADAIVVLSGGKERLPRALALVRDRVAPMLAISSVERSRHAEVARELCAKKRYRSARVICFDAVPYSTQGEARAVRRLAARLGWRSVVVVTSTFHVTRAKLLFRRCLDIPVFAVGAPSPWWRLPEEWATETGKLAVQLTVQRGC